MVLFQLVEISSKLNNFKEKNGFVILYVRHFHEVGGWMAVCDGARVGVPGQRLFLFFSLFLLILSTNTAPY